MLRLNAIEPAPPRSTRCSATPFAMPLAHRRVPAFVACAAGALLALLEVACGPRDPAPEGQTGGAGGQLTGGATGGDGTGGVVDPCTVPDPAVRRHPGTYDYESCSVCHADLWGGWVYSNAYGDAYVPAATVTLTYADSSTVSAPTASDGFFHLLEPVAASFTPCVSRCSERTCATQPHTSLDCQSAGCHGATGRLIYLTSSSGGAGGIGGASPGDCIPPASGGPRVHDPSFDGQTCVTCHEPGYVGGYVYDGVTSTTPVSQATLTVTPDGGAPLTAVSGPGGFFQIVGAFTAPYQVCVSKCPDTLCAAPATHATTADCSTCHTSALRIHLP